MNELTGKKTFRPTARQAPFSLAMDSYDCVLRDENATKADVIKPGFFNQHRSELIVGTVINCRLGHPCDGINFGYVQVISCPDAVREGDVEVSVGPFKKFTPVRHHGALEDEREKAA